MTKYVIAQIFGIMATAVCLISPQLKKKWQILIGNIFSNLLAALNFLLLGEVSAVGVCVVAILQAGLGIRRSQGDHNGVTPTYEAVIYGALYIIGGLVPFLVSGTMSQFRVLDAIPILGALLFCVSIIQTKEQRMRMFVLGNAVVFTVYDIIIQSSQVFGQIFTIVSVIIALYRYHKTSEEILTDSQAL